MKVQYDNLTRLFTEEQLNVLPAKAIRDFKDDPNLDKNSASSEITVETTTYYDENGEPIKSEHEVIDEKEW